MKLYTADSKAHCIMSKHNNIVSFRSFTQIGFLNKPLYRYATKRNSLNKSTGQHQHVNNLLHTSKGTRHGVTKSEKLLHRKTVLLDWTKLVNIMYPP